MARELLKDRTRDFVAAFCWLIRISSRPNSDFLARLDLAQFVPQQVRGVLLDIDLALKVGAIAQLPWQTKVTAEASYGAQGAGGLLSLRSERGPGRVLYGTVTLSQDRDDRLMSTVAAGGRAIPISLGLSGPGSRGSEAMAGTLVRFLFA